MMTDIFLFPSRPKSRGARLVDALRDRLEAERRRLAEARSLRGLDRLDDRLLRDIGLTRADVDRMLEAGAGGIMAGISGRPFPPDGI